MKVHFIMVAMICLLATCAAALYLPFARPIHRPHDAPSGQTNRIRMRRAEPKVGHAEAEIISHFFGIEGEIVNIRTDGVNLLTLSVKVRRSLPSALGWQPDDDRAGEVAVIHFDERLSDFYAFHLAQGELVWITFGQLDDGAADWFDEWGSHSSWMFVKDHDRFIDHRGRGRMQPELSHPKTVDEPTTKPAK